MPLTPLRAVWPSQASLFGHPSRSTTPAPLSPWRPVSLSDGPVPSHGTHNDLSAIVVSIVRYAIRIVRYVLYRV